MIRIAGTSRESRADRLFFDFANLGFKLSDLFLGESRLNDVKKFVNSGCNHVVTRSPNRVVDEDRVDSVDLLHTAVTAHFPEPHWDVNPLASDTLAEHKTGVGYPGIDQDVEDGN